MFIYPFTVDLSHPSKSSFIYFKSQVRLLGFTLSLEIHITPGNFLPSSQHFRTSRVFSSDCTFQTHCPAEMLLLKQRRKDCYMTALPFHLLLKGDGQAIRLVSFSVKTAASRWSRTSSSLLWPQTSYSSINKMQCLSPPPECNRGSLRLLWRYPTTIKSE